MTVVLLAFAAPSRLLSFIFSFGAAGVLALPSARCCALCPGHRRFTRRRVGGLTGFGWGESLYLVALCGGESRLPTCWSTTAIECTVDARHRPLASARVRRAAT